MYTTYKLVGVPLLQLSCNANLPMTNKWSIRIIIKCTAPYTGLILQPKNIPINA